MLFVLSGTRLSMMILFAGKCNLWFDVHAPVFHKYGAKLNLSINAMYQILYKTRRAISEAKQIFVNIINSMHSA
jgi:hypothetical protein